MAAIREEAYGPLETFAREVLLGAYKPEELQDRARDALVHHIERQSSAVQRPVVEGSGNRAVGETE